MSIGIKIKANNTGFKRSIRQLSKSFKDQLPRYLEKGGEEVSANIQGRFKKSYPTISGKRSKGIVDNIKASRSFFNGRDIVMGIGNIADLDKATEVMAKSTGKTYHLWKLLELGYGMKGGFRSDLYDIYPVYPTSAQGQQYYRDIGGTRRKGVHESNPDRKVKPALVFYANGKLVFASHVRHPGAEGRYFFLTMTRDWYEFDKEIMLRSVNVGMEEILQKINYKGKNA